MFFNSFSIFRFNMTKKMSEFELVNVIKYPVLNMCLILQVPGHLVQPASTHMRSVLLKILSFSFYHISHYEWTSFQGGDDLIMMSQMLRNDMISFGFFSREISTGVNLFKRLLILDLMIQL